MLPNLSGLSLEDTGVANAPSLTAEEAAEGRAADRQEEQRKLRARLLAGRRPGFNRPGTPRPPEERLDPDSRTHPPPEPMPDPSIIIYPPARGFEDYEAKDWYVYRFLQKRSEELFEEGEPMYVIKANIDERARVNGLLLPADFYSKELPSREVVKFAVLFQGMPVAVGPGLVPLDPKRFSEEACMENMKVFAENVREMGCDDLSVQKGLTRNLTLEEEDHGYCFMYEDVPENAGSDAWRVVAMFTLMDGLAVHGPQFYMDMALENEWADLKRMFETDLLYINYACSAGRNTNLDSDRGAGSRLFGELMAITRLMLLGVANKLDDKRKHRFLRSLYANGFVELYSLPQATPFWRKMNFYSRPERGVRTEPDEGRKMRRKLFFDIKLPGAT